MTTATQVVETTHMSLRQTAFQAPNTSHLSKCAYLVGNPIAHSQSPTLHHAIYSSMGQKWGQVLAETDDLDGFIRYLRADTKSMGSGVTMPFKVAVIPYLDELEAAGRAVGAVNTIFYRLDDQGRRKFIGTNTDVLGVRDAFLKNAVHKDFTGRCGLVVGGGGTCRAAVYALRDLLGCSEVYIVNRDKSEVDAVIDEYAARNDAHGLRHIASVADAELVQPPSIIVSAVPDFEPRTDNEFIARDILSTFLERGETGSPLLEMCYHPSPDTSISRLAAAAQWQVIPGIEAMLGQGLAQAELWTGIKIDDQLRKEVGDKVKEIQAQHHKL